VFSYKAKIKIKWNRCNDDCINNNIYYIYFFPSFLKYSSRKKCVMMSINITDTNNNEIEREEKKDE